MRKFLAIITLSTVLVFGAFLAHDVPNETAMELEPTVF